ncbi:hypothetical protein [Azospirillum endophyticum]
MLDTVGGTPFIGFPSISSGSLVRVHPPFSRMADSGALRP